MRHVRFLVHPLLLAVAACGAADAGEEALPEAPPGAYLVDVAARIARVERARVTASRPDAAGLPCPTASVAEQAPYGSAPETLLWDEDAPPLNAWGALPERDRDADHWTSLAYDELGRLVACGPLLDCAQLDDVIAAAREPSERFTRNELRWAAWASRGGGRVGGEFADVLDRAAWRELARRLGLADPDAPHGRQPGPPASVADLAPRLSGATPQNVEQLVHELTRAVEMTASEERGAALAALRAAELPADLEPDLAALVLAARAGLGDADALGRIAELAWTSFTSRDESYVLHVAQCLAGSDDERALRAFVRVLVARPPEPPGRWCGVTAEPDARRRALALLVSRGAAHVARAAALLDQLAPVPAAGADPLLALRWRLGRAPSPATFAATVAAGSAAPTDLWTAPAWRDAWGAQLDALHLPEPQSAYADARSTLLEQRNWRLLLDAFGEIPQELAQEALDALRARGAPRDGRPRLDIDGILAHARAPGTYDALCELIDTPLEDTPRGKPPRDVTWELLGIAAAREQRLPDLARFVLAHAREGADHRTDRGARLAMFTALCVPR